MTNKERIESLKVAMDHRFDADDNADLKIETDDPVLLAAARVVNRMGGYSEVVIAPSQEFIDLIEVVLSGATVADGPEAC